MALPTTTTCIVLCGKTGSGKTSLLQQLEQAGYPTIQIERIASHRGSAFGDAMLPAQPSQKDFEYQLEQAFLAYKSLSYIFIEQKAPSVGKRKIPGTVLAKMNTGIHVHINTDTTLRVQHILKEYGPAGKEAFANGLNKLKNRLPIETTRKATLLLQQENFTEFIYTMLDYYDETAMYNPIKKPDIIVNINNEKPDDTLHNLLESLKQSDIHIIF